MSLARSATASSPTLDCDVCIIAEGCYPHVAGGVSSWLDWLMRNQPELTFAVVAIVAGDEPRTPKYRPPANLVGVVELDLHARPRPPMLRRAMVVEPPGLDALANALESFALEGGLDDLRRLAAFANGGPRPPGLSDIVDSDLGFALVRRMYGRIVPHASFLDFFWAWRVLFGGLFAVLKFPLPRARAWHAVSTGYAGLLAARAAVETGRPALLTEHGIYTNERRIEILMADWIVDQVDKGLALDDPRLDMRDLWIRVFESYTRACYAACGDIITLFGENRRQQIALGAPPGRTRVIANGIDTARFADLPVAEDDAQPTIALIGRVVPIKDIKTFIAAVAIVRRRHPGLRALVLGPLDEDPDYAAECLRSVRDFDLDDVVIFEGRIDITTRLPDIHVVVLTSLSEAQPLTLLEAGAAGVPCVATDVGSCREILEGRPDEMPPLGPGGIVTGLVAPEETAAAISRLLDDPVFRRRCGEALRTRVQRDYESRDAARHYAALYARALAMEPV